VFSLLLRLCIKKVVHHRDDDGHALHQRDVRCIGQMDKTGGTNIVRRKAVVFTIGPRKFGIGDGSSNQSNLDRRNRLQNQNFSLVSNMNPPATYVQAFRLANPSPYFTDTCRFQVPSQVSSPPSDARDKKF
jgi:hypothetical protein